MKNKKILGLIVLAFLMSVLFNSTKSYAGNMCRIRYWNTANGKIENEDAHIGDTITLPECMFLNPGEAEFLYWIVTDDSTGEKVIRHSGATYTINGDITVETVWGSRINYVGGEYGVLDTGGAIYIEYVKIGTEMTVQDCKFNHPQGYEFDCWKKGGLYLNPGDKYLVKEPEFFLEPVWKKKISFWDNDSKEIETIQVSGREEFTVPEYTYEIPEGYEFKYWLLDDNRKHYFNDKAAPGKSIVIYNDTKIKAVLEKIEPEKDDTEEDNNPVDGDTSNDENSGKQGASDDKKSKDDNTSNDKKQTDEGKTSKEKETEKVKYSNEWIDGKWYDADGKQTYIGTLQWKSNATGWWVEDSAGWYPQDSWQKIDGVWYYFKPDGYMAMNEYFKGYWFNADGSWDDKYLLSWKSNSTGWWVEDKSGWWPQSSWLKIDGYWYYFDASGYMVTNKYLDGYWISADGVCY